MNNISFPKLGLSFDISPIAIRLPFLGGGIHWYGVIIAVGIILAVLYCTNTAKREGENKDSIIDLVLWSLPAAIVGARTYYVAFSWESYKHTPIDVFKIWEGGIAIYGGIIGAAIAAYVFCRVKKLCVLKIFDIACLGLLIGQSIGRWGNFVNAEAFGGVCNALWGMSVNNQPPVHPTFFYESLFNFIGFIVLSSLNKKRPFYGFTFFSYLVWYGTGRFFIEGLRADSLYIGTFRISQLVSLAVVLLGIIFLVKKCSEKRKKQSFGEETKNGL